jgi:hypothetical protein
MKKPMLLVAMLTAAAEEQLANARAGQSRVEELQATKRAMLEAYAQSIPMMVCTGCRLTAVCGDIAPHGSRCLVSLFGRPAIPNRKLSDTS